MKVTTAALLLLLGAWQLSEGLWIQAKACGKALLKRE